MSPPATTEIWKQVPSLPGVMASNLGRILFPERTAMMPKGGFRVYKPRPVIGSIRRSKTNAAHVYRGIWMRHFGNLKVHQLVCEAFHGPKPFPEAVVLHRDEDGLNNFETNLQWGTQKQNLNAPAYLRQLSARANELHRVRGTGPRGGFLQAGAPF